MTSNQTDRQPPKKLLAVGAGGPWTGYGRVFRSILTPLSKAFDVVHFSPNLTHPLPDSPYPVLPRQIPGDIFGREALPRLLDEHDPDFLLFCHDPPFYRVHRPVLQEHKRRTGGRPFCAFYCPIEWSDIHPATLHDMDDLNALVLYSRFGQSVANHAFEGRAAPTTRIIPHGVDTTTFFPLHGGRKVARKLLFPNHPELEDAFIILNANRNCPRKQIDVTLRAFALVAARHKDAYLYLHCGAKDSGCDILALSAELGIEDRLLLTHHEPMHPRVDDERLNLIYNACDVGLNTSTGEGWGLVVFEHAATGAAQIVPNHSACREHWQGRGQLIPLVDGAVAPEATAHSIEKLIADPGLRNSLALTGMAYANQPDFRWSVIAERWRQLFSE